MWSIRNNGWPSWKLRKNVITRILLFCNAMIPLTYPRAISNTSSSINCFALQILFVPIHKWKLWLRSVILINEYKYQIYKQSLYETIDQEEFLSLQNVASKHDFIYATYHLFSHQCKNNNSGNFSYIFFIKNDINMKFQQYLQNIKHVE